MMKDTIGLNIMFIIQGICNIFSGLQKEGTMKIICMICGVIVLLSGIIQLLIGIIQFSNEKKER